MRAASNGPVRHAKGLHKLCSCYCVGSLNTRLLCERCPDLRQIFAQWSWRTNRLTTCEVEVQCSMNMNVNIVGADTIVSEYLLCKFASRISLM